MIKRIIGALYGIFLEEPLDRLHNWQKRFEKEYLEELVEQINQIRALNPKTRLAGVLITDYEKSDTSEAAESWIRAKSGCPVFSQKIRHSKKAKDATFYRLTPLHYSIRSGAAQDYKAFAAEYVQKFGGPAAGERS